MQWSQCTRQKDLGHSIEVCPPQSLLSSQMLVSSSPSTTSCNSFLNGWFQLKERKEVGTWDSDVWCGGRERMNATLGDWHKLGFLINLFNEKVSQFLLSHSYPCTDSAKVSTVKFTDSSCYGISMMEMWMDGKVRCHSFEYSFSSCVTLLILWEDSNVSVPLVSIQFLCSVSAVGVGLLDFLRKSAWVSSPAVPEEDSFSFI